jgi:hypothetical protein
MSKSKIFMNGKFQFIMFILPYIQVSCFLQKLGAIWFELVKLFVPFIYVNAIDKFASLEVGCIVYEFIYYHIFWFILT